MPTKNPAKAITVINLKGGVGKTHTVWLLTGVCQERRRRLLCVDCDMQANLTRSLLEKSDQGSGLEMLFHPGAEMEPAELIRSTRFSHVDLLPASAALAQYDIADQKTWERSDLHFSLVETVHAARESYDYVIFDCPPRLSLVSFAALCASDFVIIPLEAADWGAQGIVQVTAAVEYVQQRYNPHLELLGYLPSRFKRARSVQQSYLVQLKEHFGRLAFDTVIPDLSRFEQAVTNAIPITLFAPSSEEARVARQLFAEVQRRIGRCRQQGTGRRRQDVQLVGGTAV